MRIFVICKVRGATDEQIAEQRACVELLEDFGYKVHWPNRGTDTKQQDPEHGTGICRTTFWAIFRAKVVAVVFDPTSEGFVADLMMTFALNELGKKRLFRQLVGRRQVVIANPEVVEQKIREETEKQISQGIPPQFVKSYTMVLKNLVQETASIGHFRS